MGRRYGHYEVVRELARGGMGVVYVARHTELGREVALKTLNVEFADEEDLARFRREGEALARLRHPGVVPVHELAGEGPQPFLVMALVEGESLQRRLDRRGPLEPRAAAELGLTLADTLHHAHQAGVLHRDVKPDNVLLTSEGRPLLTDFGIAADLSREKERLTRTGQTLGTPSYMPPEQALGDPARIGPRSDVYGIGATLYAALCGAPPFSGPSALAVMEAVLSRDPLPLRGLAPAVPPGLEAICMRCLRKDPAERYASAEALADDLRRHLDGARTQASQDAGSPRGIPPLAAVAAIAVLGCVAVAVWALQDPPAPAPSQEPQPAQRPQRAAASPPQTPAPSPPERPRRPRTPAGRLAAARDALAAGDEQAFLDAARALANDEEVDTAVRTAAMRALAEQLPGEEGAWLLRAARLQDHRAMLDLAYLLARQRDVEDATFWFEAATAGEATRADASRALAEDAYHRGQKDTARRWYEGLVAADPDDAFAKLRLGMLLRDAATTPEKGRRAVEILRAAAEGGQAPAWVKLGEIYEFRPVPGVPLDPQEARRCYRKGSDAGYEWGSLNFGKMLFSGSGGKRRDKAAAKAFQLAHDKGLRAGSLYLAKCLLEGRGVERDIEAASRYLSRAHDAQAKQQAKNYYQEALYLHGTILHSGQLGAARKDEGLRLIMQASDEGYGLAHQYLKNNQ